VGFDPGEYDEIVGALGKASEAELVEWPADVAYLVVVELDLGSFLREVEERIGIDGRGDRRDAVDEQLVDRYGRHLGDVEPAT
jgi:hypothetical protein